MITKQTYVYTQSSIVQSVGELKRMTTLKKLRQRLLLSTFFNCEQYLENTTAEYNLLSYIKILKIIWA